jgi:hypothetical protein
MPRAKEYQHLLDKLDLLRDICTATRQVAEGQGVPHSEAQSKALERLRGYLESSVATLTPARA